MAPLAQAVSMLGLDPPPPGGLLSGGHPLAPTFPLAPRVRGPHVSEAKIYLGRIRLGVLGFYGLTLLALLLWLPWLCLVTGATAFCGSLLLQSDPWLEQFMRPMVLQLGEWVLTLPEWLRYPVKDGLLYLTPLTVCCCLGAFSACLELFFAIPSHSTGLGGSIRPLVVLMCGCLHASVFACCWHCRSLIWRPHGSVAYSDLYEAAMEVGHPDPEDKPPAAASNVPPVKVEMEALHYDPPGHPGHPADHAADHPEAPEEPIAQVSQVHPSEAQASQVSQPSPEAVELLLRLPSGRRVHCHFLSSDPIAKVYDVVEAESATEPEIRNGSPYCLVTIHPKQAFQDKELTLAEAGLQNSTVLNVEMMK
eukprot:s2366_g14.t1